MESTYKTFKDTQNDLGNCLCVEWFKLFTYSWDEFIKSKNLGIEYTGDGFVYRITNERQWSLTRIKYGIGYNKEKDIWFRRKKQRKQQKNT